MKKITKEKLRQAAEICDEEDRSIEYMIEFMKGVVGVDHDCVMKYLTKYYFPNEEEV
jgi:hypothetical protein